MKVIFDPENDPPRRLLESGLPRIDVLTNRVLAKHRNMASIKDRVVYAEKQAELARRQMIARRVSPIAIDRINRDHMEHLAKERDDIGQPTWRAVAAAAVLECDAPSSWQDIKGSSRKSEIVEARHRAIAAVYAAKPNLSPAQIGNLFGGRDHSTVLHAVQKFGVKR